MNGPDTLPLKFHTSISQGSLSLRIKRPPYFLYNNAMQFNLWNGQLNNQVNSASYSAFTPQFPDLWNCIPRPLLLRCLWSILEGSGTQCLNFELKYMELISVICCLCSLSFCFLLFYRGSTSNSVFIALCKSGGMQTKANQSQKQAIYLKIYYIWFAFATNGHTHKPYYFVYATNPTTAIYHYHSITWKWQVILQHAII